MDVPVWVWLSLLAIMVLSVIGGDHFADVGDRKGYMACGLLLCMSVFVAMALYACKYTFVPKAVEGRPGYDEPRGSIYSEEFEQEVRDRMD